MSSKTPAMSNPDLPPVKSGGDMPLVAHLTELRSHLGQVILLF